MAAIVTLTPNPAIDLSTKIDRIVPSIKLRCTAAQRDPGGGGVNVARVIKRLGGDVEAIFPIGGFTGQLLRRLVGDEGIPYRVIEVDAETREDFSVTETSTKEQYRFLLPGLPLRKAEWPQCLEVLAASTPHPKFIVASGSLPPGVPANFYEQAADIAARLEAKFVLDTSGAPLVAALNRGVYMIKPNLREMCELTGANLAEERDWIAAARQLIAANKTQIVALSLGHLGAMLITRDQAFRAPALPIRPLSSVGAGDSFLGAIVFSLAHGESLVEAFRLGVAAGSAALIHEGTELSQADDVYRLRPQVQIAQL